jgi:hypothetical protein
VTNVFNLRSTGISIAITTYRRPRRLVDCIESVCGSRHRPIEIVISDNDYSPESKAAVASVAPPPGVTLRHLPGPASGYASNARAAISECSNELIMLLHDDNLLVEGGLDVLLAAWTAYGSAVDAAFGRQYIVSESGKIDLDASSRNDQYYQKDAAPGPQPSNLWSALTGQFPTDGMLMRRSIAVAACYPSEAEVGTKPVDFHFSVRYAHHAQRPYVLVGDRVSCVRRSRRSITTTCRVYDGHLGYEALKRIQPETALEAEAKEAALDRFAAAAIMGYLCSGHSHLAGLVLRAHGLRLDKSWLVRIGLAAAVAAAHLGINVLRLPWAVRRQRFWDSSG